MSLRLGILTTGRQDWGVLRPLCMALRGHPAFQVEVFAGGMACSARYGRIVDAVRALGMEVVAELAWSQDADAVAQTSDAVRLVGDALGERRPDALILVGDRYETAGAAIAAAIIGIPINHLYGGEETEGAIDNALRHSITKLSHLHFVSHPDYADRVVQMGEPPSSVHVVGSLGVDNIRTLDLPGRAELERTLGMSLESPVGLVTVHPTTLAEGSAEDELDVVLSVIREHPARWVITLPNADPGNERIREAFQALALAAPNVVAVTALGEARYLGLMRLADFVLGNSSSGITEAPSMGVPTINVGDRQKGRVRSPSIIDVPCDAQAIRTAVRQALTPEWRAEISRQPRPFGEGDSAQRIIAVLERWTPPHPARKQFHVLTFDRSLVGAFVDGSGS
jgi:UDP-hydrolysing UDP-N-acetyl-D-glucosamine 2-epimerase